MSDIYKYVNNPSMRYGKRLALLIGVDDYPDYIVTDQKGNELSGCLSYPVENVEDLAKILRGNFGFDTRILPNPTDVEIKDGFKQLAQHTRVGDAVIIYFSGHGYKVEGVGHIIPNNATIDNPNTWISAEFIIESCLQDIKASHIFFACDMCFAGSILKNFTSRDEKVADNRSIKFFLAGTTEQKVPDKSYFAEFIIEGLQGLAAEEDNGEILVRDLISYVDKCIRNIRKHKVTTQRVFDHDVLKDRKSESAEELTFQWIVPHLPPEILRGLNKNKQSEEYRETLIKLASDSKDYPKERRFLAAQKFIEAARNQVWTSWEEEKEKENVFARLDTLKSFPKIGEWLLPLLFQDEDNLTLEVIEALSQLPYDMKDYWPEESYWKFIKPWLSERIQDITRYKNLKSAVTAWRKQTDPEIQKAWLWEDELLQPYYQMIDRYDPNLTPEEKEFIRLEFDRLMDEINDPNTEHLRRWMIGVRLNYIRDRSGRLGDPRKGVGVLKSGIPDIEWCQVPSGKVKVQGKHEEINVPSFYIAKYQVTYKQFNAFCDDSDTYEKEEYWKGFPEEFKRQKMEDQHFKIDNHPREVVSWYQAVAFCRWMSEKLGYTVRLPTEWEWQSAATGGRLDYIYPWGSEWNNAYANTKESGLSRTTAVGMYPLGASPVEALDMAGNVLDWCKNEADPETLGPEDLARDHSIFRAARGGGWSGAAHTDWSRVDHRAYGWAEGSVNVCGFRLAKDNPDPDADK